MTLTAHDTKREKARTEPSIENIRVSLKLQLITGATEQFLGLCVCLLYGCWTEQET